MDKKITISHGSGGIKTHQLIKEVFLPIFDNIYLRELDDSAFLPSINKRYMCMTTDSYTVSPIFFPGGDIGKLAIDGTLNDIAVSGGKPLYITASVIIEEGFEIETLKKIALSMKEELERNNVYLVGGDLKVVEKGKGDKIFITTTGIGEILDKDFPERRKGIEAGDVVIINGGIGEHGATILALQNGFDIGRNLRSDCQSLVKMLNFLVNNFKGVKFIRDATRGGIGMVLNEIVENKDYGIRIIEDKIPVKESVQAICEILGIEPCYLACEGRAIFIVNKREAESFIEKMKEFNEAPVPAIIGEVVDKNYGKVTLRKRTGAEILLDMPVGEQLPRIC